MVVTGLCFVGVTAIVKHVGGRIPAAESAFLRYLLGLVFLIPAIQPLVKTRLTARLLGLFALRGAAQTLGVILWFFAMTQLPIAEVTAIGYISPVVVTLGAALFLGETLAVRRLLAIGVALVGALIILRPGMRELEPGHMAMIGTAIFFAGSFLVAKQLSTEVPAVVVVAMLSITVTIGLAPFAIADWVTPTLTELAWFFGVAAFATAGHYTMTLAFAAAPLAVTQPVTFLQLLWSVLLGVFVFGEPVDIWVVAGGSLILGAVSFITWREAVLRRRITPALMQTKG